MESERFEPLVCSPDLAKKLKEAGIEQASVCWWQEIGGNMFDFKIDPLGQFSAPICYSAFTCTEMAWIISSKAENASEKFHQWVLDKINGGNSSLSLLYSPEQLGQYLLEAYGENS